MWFLDCAQTAPARARRSFFACPGPPHAQGGVRLSDYFRPTTHDPHSRTGGPCPTSSSPGTTSQRRRDAENSGRGVNRRAVAEDHGTQYESVILNGVAVTDGCRKSLTATQRRKGAEKSRRDVVGRPSFSTTFSGPFSSRNTPISTVETWPAKCVSSAFLCAFASLRRCRNFYRIAWLSRPQESANCYIRFPIVL